MAQGELTSEGKRRFVAGALIVVGFLALGIYSNFSSRRQMTDHVWSNIAAWGFILGGGYFAFLALLWAMREASKAIAKGIAEGKEAARKQPEKTCPTLPNSSPNCAVGPSIPS